MTRASLQARVEARNQQLRRALVATIGAYSLWQVPALLNELKLLPPPMGKISSLIAVAGGALWLLVLLRLHRLQLAIQADPALREALNDERIRHTRQRAFNTGFVVVLGYLAGMRVLCSRLDVSAAVSLQLGLFLAVTSTLSAFLVYDRNDA
jgi:hypothetical protein